MLLVPGDYLLTPPQNRSLGPDELNAISQLDLSEIVTRPALIIVRVESAGHLPENWGVESLRIDPWAATQIWPVGGAARSLYLARGSKYEGRLVVRETRDFAVSLDYVAGLAGLDLELRVPLKTCVRMPKRPGLTFSTHLVRFTWRGVATKTRCDGKTIVNCLDQLAAL